MSGIAVFSMAMPAVLVTTAAGHSGIGVGLSEPPDSLDLMQPFFAPSSSIRVRHVHDRA